MSSSNYVFPHICVINLVLFSLFAWEIYALTLHLKCLSVFTLSSFLLKVSLENLNWKLGNQVAVGGGSTAGSDLPSEFGSWKWERKSATTPAAARASRYTGPSRQHYPGESRHLNEAVLFTGERVLLLFPSLQTVRRAPPQQGDAALACELASVC